jgi:hypothetical protein
MNQTTNLGLGSVLTAVEDAGLFSSLCTIQSPSQAPDALGQQNLTNYTNRTGLVDIPCMNAPGFIPDVRGGEMMLPGWTSEQNSFHVLLDGYYPSINQKDRAVIDGIALEVMSVESDSQKIMTRMSCRRYSL